MKERIERRIAELQAELDAGRRLQHELRAQQEHVERSLLRINGALQVLNEVMSDAGENEDDKAPGSSPALHSSAATG